MTAKLPWAEIQRVFDLAIAHERGERAAFLDQACGDPDLRREIDALLAADEQASGFLDPPTPPAHDPEFRIGAYRLLHRLGDGDTSSVYLAARDDDHYHQQVAIKVIRPGICSRQIIERFRQERQILASLSHPHIARLLDGGTTPVGRPYLVMEYVDGEPIDAHCRSHDLDLARRLELFALVCQAVHFAHRKGVVHRDLKPSNILVDADGTPKLVDFGIAKLLDPGQFGIRIEPTPPLARLMTPHYASPEQVQGKPVGTASDVYSLGVILYKLITGRRPYELTSQAICDIERVVCETTPLPPSQAVRESCHRRLPRDLDYIVLMSMRKEPERRYGSAQDLADDVRRCLQRRPVLARRSTLRYRVWSSCRHHASAVVVGAIAVSVACTVTAASWRWRQTSAELDRTEARSMSAGPRRDIAITPPTAHLACAGGGGHCGAPITGSPDQIHCGTDGACCQCRHPPSHEGSPPLDAAPPTETPAVDGPVPP